MCSDVIDMLRRHADIMAVEAGYERAIYSAPCQLKCQLDCTR